MELNQLKELLEDCRAKSNTSLAMLEICTIAMREISEKENRTEWECYIFQKAKYVFDAAKKRLRVLWNKT